MSKSSRQLTLKKAPGDRLRDLLCVQLASYLGGGGELADVDDAPTPA